MQSTGAQPKRTKRYVDEAYRLILEKPGVEDVLIINRSGVPIKTSMQKQDALQHACLYDNLREKCQAFLQKMEPPQNLSMLRVRTKYHEVIITPDSKITLLVIQNASDTFLGQSGTACTCEISHKTFAGHITVWKKVTSATKHICCLPISHHSYCNGCPIDIKMCIQPTNQLVLTNVVFCFDLVLSDIANAGHYSQTLIGSIMDIYENRSTHKNSLIANDPTADFDTPILIPNYIYPYLLLAVWITSISIIICCCLHCKCQQAESMTSYNSNSFELQEVHVLDHPLPHVKGCVCLACLQRQIAQELQLKSVQ